MNKSMLVLLLGGAVAVSRCVRLLQSNSSGSPDELGRLASAAASAVAKLRAMSIDFFKVKRASLHSNYDNSYL